VHGRRHRSNRKRTSRRRSHRRNYRRNRGFFGRIFKKNPTGILAMGLIGFGGFALAKFSGNLISKAITRLTSSAAPATPAAASGLGAIESLAQPLGAIVATGVGGYLVNKFVTDESVKQPLLFGLVISGLHSVVMAALGAISPGAKAVLSGDDAAARLSAMYGMGGGGGTSIMPHYAPINGMGEYIASTNGLGEYFDSGVEGLGNYIGNADLFQAAAGYGATETANSNHVDPSSDLDRELTIAEAAAGVGLGQAYQAAAGLPSYAAQAGMRGYGRLGEYFDSGVSGMGDVDTVSAANTWIPGMSNPQLWAGTRPVDQPQEETAMVPAGVLSSPGSAGVFG
jgi:hypothetical protein